MEIAMALKVELKAGERIIIGDCVVTNSDQSRARLLIEGTAPILREKDIMTVDQANTPGKRLYLAVQLMYTSNDPQSYHDVYFSLMKDILHAAPSTWRYIEAINNQILTGEMYKALKEAKKLMAYEKDLLDNATCGESVWQGCERDRKST
jgi:flagellar protein FlbT